MHESGFKLKAYDFSGKQICYSEMGHTQDNTPGYMNQNCEVITARGAFSIDIFMDKR
jgi:hypothetical protein